MVASNPSAFILLADDDDDDCLLMKQAFQKAKFPNEHRRVRNGEELMKTLLPPQGARRDASASLPMLILLDLNMPKKDGRQALREIKTHPELRRIPVVVLTTSNLEEDVLRSYQDGANSYIRKPTSFDKLVDSVRTLDKYWFETVELPAPAPRAGN